VGSGWAAGRSLVVAAGARVPSPGSRTCRHAALPCRTLHAAQDAIDDKWVTQMWFTSGLQPKKGAGAGKVQRGSGAVARDGTRKGFRR
jgi:hypothetical protein